MKRLLAFFSVISLLLVQGCNPPEPTPTPEDKAEIIIGTVDRIPAEGGTFTVDIQYNTDYTVEVEESAQAWITFNGTKTMSSGKLFFLIAENTGIERTGTVVIKDIKGKLQPSSLKFVQDASELIAKERAALIAFYNANNGDKWVDNTNWCSDRPVSEWTGVSVEKSTGHVIRLAFLENNVYGSFPKEIADLTELTQIIIRNDAVNFKGGELPEEIGALRKLEVLSLQNYPLSGKLPENLFNLISLKTLLINNAHGMEEESIPPAIGNLVNLEILRLSGMNLTGYLPSEMGQLGALQELYLAGNHLSGGIPETFGGLINLSFVKCDSNHLSGEIPNTVQRLDNYWRIWPGFMTGNDFTEEQLKRSLIPAPISPKVKTVSGKILDIEAEIAQNRYTVLFNLNPSSGDAQDCLNKLVLLYERTKDKGLGVITFYDNNFYYSDDKEAHNKLFIDLIQNSGAGWESFYREMYADPYPDDAPFYARRGSAMYPYGIENSIVIIGPEKTVEYTTLIDKNGRGALDRAIEYLQTVLDSPFEYYESSSLDGDGTVTVLQQASVGKGIDIVITGDAFSDRLVADGTLMSLSKQAMEDYFSVEPLKSLRNRFNVYMVDAISKNEDYFNGCETAFDGVFGIGSAVSGDNNKVLRYARKAVSDDRMDNVVVIVLMNSLKRGGMTKMYDPVDSGIYAGGASIIWIPYKGAGGTDGISKLASTIVHEAGGHGLAKLGDEYAYFGNGDIGESAREAVKSKQKLNWYLNVDFTSDPDKTLWGDFYRDGRYAEEKIGAYEGGYTYWFGVWRPTEQSIMNNNLSYSSFNAPSRAQIYKRVMKLSEGESWEFDYETFVKWDKAHYDTGMKAVNKGEPAVEESEHVPPVMIGKTWREVMDNK